MSRERPHDIARSILRRLGNAARRNGEDPQVTQVESPPVRSPVLPQPRRGVEFNPSDVA